MASPARRQIRPQNGQNAHEIAKEFYAKMLRRDALDAFGSGRNMQRDKALR
jgi:hypothetical protein